MPILNFIFESTISTQVPHVTGQCEGISLMSQALSLGFISSHVFLLKSFNLKVSILSAHDTEGNALGTELGTEEGTELGIVEGTELGTAEGDALGTELGTVEGVLDGQSPHVALQV